MDFLLNLIWHIPFGGFMIALSYAVMGLLMCCTIILIPAGKAYFELASFFLAPFSRRLVNKEDLARLNGEAYSQGAYTTIIRILYFPFGCIASISAIVLIISEAISIIGIPCAMVWTRTFSALFNPFNKVCVSKEIADKIEAMNGSNTNETAAASTSTSHCQAQPAKTNTVRNYDMEKLQEIVSNAETYNPELVQKCQTEIEIRAKAVNLEAKAEATAYEELMTIVADPETYAPEWIYACELQIARIVAANQEEERKLIEEARLKAEEEEARKKEEREAWWKKNGIYVYISIAAVIAGALILFFSSDSWHYRQGINASNAENRNIEKAVKHLSKVENIKKPSFAVAQHLLFQINLYEKNDTAQACKNLKNAVCSNNWDFCVPAFSDYAYYRETGDLEPYLKKDLSIAAKTYKAATYHEERIKAVRCLYHIREYDEAIEVFDANIAFLDLDNTDAAGAYRFAAMIHRYGLGSNEADWKLAYKYFEKSFAIPEATAEHYAEYADLCVLNHLNSSIYTIETASNYYKLAYDAARDDDPFKESYRIRKEITSSLIQAYEKDEVTPYMYKKGVEWDSYKFDNGTYRGMYKSSSRGPAGWGVFSLGSSVRIANWKHINADGYSLCVGDYGFRVGLGYGSAGHITEGVINWYGDKSIGTFDKWELTKGEQYDVHGFQIQKIR